MNRLSVLQKHIYVKQGLQRQGSQKKDKQLPQAIDIALQKAESRIIKDRLFPDPENPLKFQINQKYVSDIQNILVFDKELITFQDRSYKSYGVLPYDFCYLVSDTSNVIEDCKEEFLNSTEDKTERVFIIPFVSTKSSSPYYSNVKVKKLGNERSITFTPYQTKEENVFIINNIINEFKILGLDIYWETYKNVYKSNCFLVPSLDSTLTVNINIDDQGYQTIEYQDLSVKTFKSTLTTVNERLNRDVKADFLLSANTSFYNKSIPVSPLAAIQDNKIVVLGTERFLVNKILINYIRTPRKISLALNQSSELSGSVHEEICDLAIQILKKQIEDESYIKEVQDNKGRIE